MYKSNILFDPFINQMPAPKNYLIADIFFKCVYIILSYICVAENK